MQFVFFRFLDDLNRVHVFSDFAWGFQFWSKFISVLQFAVIVWTVLRFLLYSNSPSWVNFYRG